MLMFSIMQPLLLIIKQTNL